MSMETKRPTPQGGHRAAPGAGYEQSDAHIADLLKFGFWMAVVIAVTLFAMKWTFNYMERTQTVSVPAGPFTRPRELPPSPRLQAEPHQELKDYCEAEVKEMNSYGWINQRLHVVRIPIDRAMDLVLQNGLPVRAAGPTGAAAVEVLPATVAGGAELEGPCAYLSSPAADGEPSEPSAEK
ncbi:MAG: hypothetical protein ABSA57_09230 [Candidatus Acidiferrales bacterium]|jgi:hypothetical protein